MHRVKKHSKRLKRYLKLSEKGIMAALATVAVLGIVGAGMMATTAVYAQSGGAQEESEGDLTVVINGETFTTGQTIVISGSVDDGDISSGPYVEIFDPEGNQIAFDSPNLSADDTFTFSLVAGDNDEQALADVPMDTSGNYRVLVRIYPSFGSTDEVDMEFEYIVTPSAAEEEGGGGEDGGRETTLGSLIGAPEEEGEEEGAMTGQASRGLTSQFGTSSSLPSTLFQSNIDLIRVGIPEGWIIEDIDNLDLGENNVTGELVELCLRTQAIPEIGGGEVCPEGVQDRVSVFRFGSLKSLPEFQSVIQGNGSITISDFVAYFIQYMEQRVGFTDFTLVQNVDRVVDVIDSQTNETIGTASARFIETSYLDANGIPGIDLALLVLDAEGNTGYALLPVGALSSDGQLPIEHQQILDSFGLMQNNSSNQTLPATTTVTSVTVDDE